MGEDRIAKQNPVGIIDDDTLIEGNLMLGKAEERPLLGFRHCGALLLWSFVVITRHNDDA